MLNLNFWTPSSVRGGGTARFPFLFCLEHMLISYTTVPFLRVVGRWRARA